MPGLEYYKTQHELLLVQNQGLKEAAVQRSEEALNFEFYKTQYTMLLDHNQELKESVTQLKKQVDPEVNIIVDELRSDTSVIQQLLFLVEQQLAVRSSTADRIITLLIEDIYETIAGKEEYNETC